jgi:hypothetical protein
MLALLTSCGRHDLLERTVFSLYDDQKHHDLTTFIHEDSEILPDFPLSKNMIQVQYAGGKGQHHSIDKFLGLCAAAAPELKHYLHVEDDWEFDNSEDWIAKSLEIMEQDPTIIKVICRAEHPHECKFENGWGYVQPAVFGGNMWYGFSWNPGVTRLDLLKKFDILRKSEYELSVEINQAGFKVAYIEKPFYTHIGNGRTTRKG